MSNELIISAPLSIIIPEDVVPSVEINIINLLQTYIAAGSTISNISFELNAEKSAFFLELMKQFPGFFRDMEDILKNIVQDNVIDSKDIPQIIMLIKKLYELMHKLKDSKITPNQIAEFSSYIIKMIIYICVAEKIIKVEDSNKDIFFMTVNSVIVSCLELLQLAEEVSQLSSTNGCFSFLFSGKK